MPESTSPPDTSSPHEKASADSVADVARAYLDAFSRADPEEIASHVSDDFVNEHTAALGSNSTSRERYLDRLPNFLADMTNLHYDIESLVTSGDLAAAFYTMTALWQGRAPIRVRGVMRLHVEGDVITHRTDYWDSAVFLTQVSQDAREAFAPFGIG